MNCDALRIAREALGMTQTDLAKAGSLEQSDVSRWERGLRIPNTDQIQTLGQCYWFRFHFWKEMFASPSLFIGLSVPSPSGPNASSVGGSN